MPSRPLKSGQFLLILLSLVAAASCRPALPERSKLWSVRTADDFARLVKNGRRVAGVEASDPNGQQLALTSTPSVGGIQAAYLEMDKQNESVIFAQFDARTAPVINRSAVETFTRDFINRAASDLRIDPTELRPIELTPGRPNQVLRGFTREISGIPLRDSRLIFVFAATGNSLRLIEVQNRTFGHLKPAERPVGSRLDQTKLSQVLRASDVTINAAGDSFVLDQRRSDPKLVPATWYQVNTGDGKAYTLTFSGGNEPALIEAFSHRTDAALETIVYSRSWAGEKKFQRLPDLAIETSNGNQLLDSQGQIPGGPVTGKVTFRNQWFSATSAAGKPTTFDVMIDGNRSVIRTDNNEPASIINVYSALARVRAFVSQYFAANEVNYFGRRLQITTDMADTCNAYYQAATLNFFASGGNCGNMAFVNDVIYHEWGHGLDDYTGPGTNSGGGMTDGAFSEGIGDIIAMFMNRDSSMGLGFFTTDPSRPIRKLDNKKVYVQGQESEVHAQGTIIGGAFWELRRRMINKYGDAGHDKSARLFFRHLLEAESYLQSYQIIQRLADDDNNPATRHGDWCIVNQSFAAKGLAPSDSCQDDFNEPAAGLESKVFFALGDALSNGSSPLFVSAAIDAASSARVCEGKDTCAQSIAIPFMKTEAGIKIFGPVSWNARDNQLINVDILDSSAKLVTRRVVRFTKK